MQNEEALKEAHEWIRTASADDLSIRYTKITDTVGLKILSYEWNNAQKEVFLQNSARERLAPYGIYVPKVYGILFPIISDGKKCNGIVMEHIEGRHPTEREHYIMNEPKREYGPDYPAPLFVSWLTIHLKQCGVIHSDLHCGNVILDNQDRVVVIDWGY